MKKTSGLPGIVGLTAILFTIGAFLFPLGAGLVIPATGESFMGYDFVFGNTASQITNEGSMIAVFVLLIIAALFQLIAVVFGWFGGKFTSFLHIVSGFCLAACAVLFFLSFLIIGAWLSGTSVMLGYGFIAAGACSAVSAILSLIIGFKGMSEKQVA